MFQKQFKIGSQNGGTFDIFKVKNGIITIDNEKDYQRLLSLNVIERGVISEYDPAIEREEVITQREIQRLKLVEESPLFRLFSEDEIADMTACLVSSDYDVLRSNVLELIDFRKNHVDVEAETIGDLVTGALKEADAPTSNGSVPKDTSHNEENPIVLTVDNFDKVYNDIYKDDEPKVATVKAPPPAPTKKAPAPVQTSKTVAKGKRQS